MHLSKHLQSQSDKSLPKLAEFDINERGGTPIESKRMSKHMGTQRSRIEEPAFKTRQSNK
jgi:hypothetical protein